MSKDKGLRQVILKMLSETKFFNEIFEDFISLGENLHDNEIWRSNSILKLMTEMDNNVIIEEGLKIILQISNFKEHGYLFDSYESESFSSGTLIGPDKILMESILKEEFI